MQWFTIGPAALDRIRTTTRRIRERIGTRQIAERVRGLPEQELGELLNDVLALVDESEGILGRVRNDTPSRSLPRPFDLGGRAPDATELPPSGTPTPAKPLPRPFTK